MLSSSNHVEFKSRVNRLGWSLCMMFASILVLENFSINIEYALWNLGSEKISIAVGAVIDSICYVGYFLIPAWFYYAISKNKDKEYIKFTPKFDKYLPLMILAGIGLVFTTAILNDLFCEFIGYQLPSEDYTQYMSDAEIVALFMTLSLAPAFAEELFFRGVIYTNLRPYGKVFAVIVSSVAFGLMHQNVGQLFYTIVAGVMMALIYEYTGSIWGSVFMHMFNNLFSVFQTAVIYRFDNTSATVILYLAQTVLIFAGIVSTVILLCLKRKKGIQNREEQKPPRGLFGEDKLSYVQEKTIDFGQAIKVVIKSPGMICFAAISIVFIILHIAMFSGGNAVA